MNEKILLIQPEDRPVAKPEDELTDVCDPETGELLTYRELSEALNRHKILATEQDSK